MINSSLGSTASFKESYFKNIQRNTFNFTHVTADFIDNGIVRNLRLLLPGACDLPSSGMWHVTRWWTPNVSRYLHYLKRPGTNHPVTCHLKPGQTSDNRAVFYSPLNILTKHESWIPATYYRLHRRQIETKPRRMASSSRTFPTYNAQHNWQRVTVAVVNVPLQLLRHTWHLVNRLLNTV